MNAIVAAVDIYDDHLPSIPRRQPACRPVVPAPHLRMDYVVKEACSVTTQLHDPQTSQYHYVHNSMM